MEPTSDDDKPTDLEQAPQMPSTLTTETGEVLAWVPIALNSDEETPC